LGSAVAQDSFFYKLFIKGITPGLNPPVTLNLIIFTLTFGFTLTLNMVAVIGVVLALLLFKRFS
jgi:hypothetical protein